MRDEWETDSAEPAMQEPFYPFDEYATCELWNPFIPDFDAEEHFRLLEQAEARRAWDKANRLERAA